MMKKLRLLFVLLWMTSNLFSSPVTGLLERIDKGASSKFIIERQKSETDFFELDQKGDKVIIRGNDYVNIATGLNWYLKYYAGIHLSWNGMTAKLPAVLPPVTKKERHETDLPYRYDLNYCTFSYSMAFWDWERWEKEIDWMALHGINLSLALTGTESVWRNVLLKLGYTKDEINEFVAGPGFTAWWLMNNLEGWGGPNPESWYTRQEKLQKKIVKRMREYGIEPVLPGYCGMVPHNAKEKLGLNVVRLKKKINALIDLLEKTQKEKQYLNTFVDGYIRNNAPVELRIKEVIHVLNILTKEAKWLDSSYQTSSSRNYYRIKTEDFEDVLDRTLVNIPRKKMIKIMANIGVLKCDDGHYTYSATIQRTMYRVYMLKKSAVNTLIGEQDE